MADILFTIAAAITLAAMILSFLRLLMGPTASDRAVGLDAMTIITIPLITYIAFKTGLAMYIDVALIYALASFVGVVAVARYLERGM